MYFHREFCLIFIFVLINFVISDKCEFYIGGNHPGYNCNLKHSSENVYETHSPDKNDNDVERVLVSENLSLNQSEYSFCQRFKNLQYLDVKRIKSVDDDLLKHCKYLKEATISYTNIQKLYENLFYKNINLIKLDLSSNKLATLPENLFFYQKNLEKLTLNENQISFLPSNIFQSLIKLLELELASNRLNTLPESLFENLYNLELLDLCNNRLSELPRNVFSSLENLMWLYLCDNRLTVIHSDLFEVHMKLVKIDLSFNRINGIDGLIIDNTAVTWLYLEYNVCSQEKITERDMMKQTLKRCLENYVSRPAETTTVESGAWSWIESDNFHCGKPKKISGNVFYGSQIKHGSYPWNAALIHSNGQFFCGGTLVSNKLIITAAHCIEGKRGRYNFVSKDISVILGAHNISTSHERGKITVGVKAIHVHHEWNPNIDNYDADIAILELEDEIIFNRFIQPICLAESNTEAASKLFGFVTGFGKSEHDSTEDIARLVITPIQNYMSCSNSKSIQSLISNRAFCGGFANGTGVCTGDSGSGLVVFHDNTYYLRGIVSASLYGGITGCNLYEYSIFTDILGFYGWIKSGKDDKILLKESLGRIRKLEAQIRRNRKGFDLIKSTNHLPCKFNKDSWYWFMGFLYQCKVEQTFSIKSRKMTFVNVVEGNHWNSYSNNEVNAFTAHSNIIKSFPQGLDIHFPNLKGIFMWHNSLQELKQSDIKSLVNLNFLDLWNNEIEIISRDLFKFNTKLRHISFTDNRISFIDPNVFNNLIELHNLLLNRADYLDKSSCINTRIQDDRDAILDLLHQLDGKCGRKIN